MDLQLDRVEQDFLLIFRYRSPGSNGAVKRTGQAVVETVVDQGRDFLEFADLLADLFSFRVCQAGRIQFIAEGTVHSNDSAGLEGGDPAVLLIGTDGYMGADSGNGISERGPVLDPQAVNGV